VSVIFRPRVFELSLIRAYDGARWLAALGAGRRPVLLDSAATGVAASNGGGPFSLLGFDPLQGVGAVPQTLAELRPYLAQLEVAEGAELPGPFYGGFLGALSFELGVAGEAPPAAVQLGEATPRIIGGLFVDFLVHDHGTERSYLVLGDEPGDGRPPLEARRRSVEQALARGKAPPAAKPAGPLLRHTEPVEHRRRVEEARASIKRGELYQANLAHRFTRSMTGHPRDIYAALRKANPAPYAAYVPWGQEEDGAPVGALLCASPELLLEYDGQLARTRPIKGTAPRGSTPGEDARLARELLASRKDLAELTMIVDLERNDLGRVAQTGSVRVEGLPTLQSLASVHHLFADVLARPRPGQGALELLAALFPGGSITGAPKLAAMELIAELEGEERGFFTGSAGFIDCRGQACFNILIRTLVWRRRGGAQAGEVSYHVGGGITWASQAAAEDAETLDKGAALAAALEGVGPRAGDGAGNGTGNGAGAGADDEARAGADDEAGAGAGAVACETLPSAGKARA
jgi:para-aminobenzoate synthetase component 1